LTHGRRKFTEIAEAFPTESAVVVNALKLVYEHDEEARSKQLSATERLLYHQTYSAPVFTALRTWLEEQTTQRLVEPNSSLGNAIAYMLEPGELHFKCRKNRGVASGREWTSRRVSV